MKLRSSVIAGKLSGAAGDVVAAVIRGVQYVRTRVIPHNPNTIPQQLVRSAWTRTVRCYQALAGDLIIFLKALGVERQLTGFNCYLKACRSDEANLFGHRVMPANTHLQSVVGFLAETGVGAGQIDISWDTAGWLVTDLPVAFYRKKVPAQSYYEVPWSPVNVGAVKMNAGALTITGLTAGADYVVALVGNRPEHEVEGVVIPNAYGGGAFGFDTAGAA